jgi:hypothetical protein
MTKAKSMYCIPLFLCACVSSPPKNTHNICSIFKEKDSWYSDAKESSEKWGVPLYVSMAIMHQESRFIADARPPRSKVLGFIPWSRPSSAYGYAQALDGTWDKYLETVDPWGDDRDDFADAHDFIGWYCSVTHKTLGVSRHNARKLYLAYHEGDKGYSRKTYLKKPWLMKVAKKVSKNSKRYKSQLSTCEDELKSSGWFFW